MGDTCGVTKKFKLRVWSTLGMSLFRSKLWEFSAADQILNLGWFKAYLSSLWAFVPHPQTFSSYICFLLRIILFWIMARSFDCQINSRSVSVAGSFPGQVFVSNPGPSPTSFIISSHLLINFMFFSFLIISATGENISWEVLVTSAVVALSGLDGTSKWDFQAHKHSHRHKLVFSMSRALDKSHCHFFSSSASWFICQLSKGFQARERQV